jgi:hypothetical protein
MTEFRDAISVSMVSSAIDIQTRDFDATAIIKIIRCGEMNIRTQVEVIRKTLRRELDTHGDHTLAKRAVAGAKKQLPAVLWSGTFTERANEKLVNHSGLLCADLDNLALQLKDVREKLSHSPHVWAMFISPSGDGLKVVFRVPADASQHRGSFRAVEQHVKELVGVQIDESCKDVARLCFLSYDPEIFHNPDAAEIEPLPEPKKPRYRDNGHVDLSQRQRIVTEILGSIDWQSENSGVVTCPGKHLHTTGDGVRDCMIDLDQPPTLHCLHNSCRGIVSGVNHEIRSRIGKVEYTDSEKRERRMGSGFYHELGKLRQLGGETLEWLRANDKGYSQEILERFKVQQSVLRRYDQSAGSGERGLVFTEPCIVIPAGRVLRAYCFRLPKTERWCVVPAGYGAQWLGDLSYPELVVVEGEWDFLRLHDMGFDHAVTHTAGAGAWLPQWTPLFRNKVVWICYDRDLRGQRGAGKVARNISPLAREVRFVDLPLPGTSEANDVSDFFPLGGTRGDFEKLLKSARPYVNRFCRTRK